MAIAKLTAKQARFVEQYLISGNATDVARRAGYSANSAKEIGAQNLTKLNIQRDIAAKQAILAEKTENLAIDRQNKAMEILRRAMEKGALDTAIRANDQLIRLGGHYEPDKIDVNSHEAWLKRLK